jgi:hypothetical protein
VIRTDLTIPMDGAMRRLPPVFEEPCMKRSSLVKSLSLSLWLLFALAMVPTAKAASDVSETTFTIPAGETITLDVSAFCLEFGEPFPARVSLTADKASINVRRVMKAAALTGAIQDEVLQTQLAIWRAVEGDWSVDEDEAEFALASALFTASSKQNTAPLDAQGLPLNAALRSGAVEVEVVEWEALNAEQLEDGDEPYYGLATLSLKNTSDEDLDLYVPLGLVLASDDEDAQDMGIAAVERASSMMAVDEADETDDEAADEAVSEEDADSDKEMSDTSEGDKADATASDAEDEGASSDETDAAKDESDDADEESAVDDPDELPVTGLPGVPDTLLAMIIGVIVLTAGLALRRG